MKKASPKPVPQPVTPEPAAPSVRIVKIATCPSLSGKTTLTYHVGCHADSAIQCRLFDSSGGGYFSKDWIALSAIQEIIEQAGNHPVTSHRFNPLFRGKSVNTEGFLLAVLLSEGLLGPVQEKPRCYQRLNAEGFIQEINALIVAGVDLSGEKPPVSVPASKSKKSPIALG